MHSSPPDLSRESLGRRTDDAAPPAYRFFDLLTDCVAALSTIWILFVMVAGGFGWRGGPPPVMDFLVYLIVPAALGCGLGIGAIRSRTIRRRMFGGACVVICGWLLVSAAVGLLDGHLDGMQWD